MNTHISKIAKDKGNSLDSSLFQRKNSSNSQLFSLWTTDLKLMAQESCKKPSKIAHQYSK